MTALFSRWQGLLQQITAAALEVVQAERVSVWLADAGGGEQCLFLGPDGAGLKLLLEGQYPPKSVIPVGVDPVRNPGVFEFADAIAYD